MRDSVDITVVMAVYNEEVYLAACLESIIHQSFTNWELIIVNDGSIDKTKSILEQFATIDGRIKVINLQTNHKLAYCLNLAISKAKGDYIARIDGDDWMYPNRLMQQYSFMNANQSIGVLGTDVHVIDEDDRVISYWRYPNSDKELKRMLIKTNPFAHPAVMIRKSVIDTLDGPYSSRYSYCEDYEMWIRLSNTTEFHSLATPGIKYRMHSNQVTQLKAKKVSKDNLRLISHSVIKGDISFISIMHIWKLIIYYVSPKWAISFKNSLKNGSRKVNK